MHFACSGHRCVALCASKNEPLCTASDPESLICLYSTLQCSLVYSTMHKNALGFIVAQCRAIVFVHRLRFTSLVFVLARKVKVQVSFALLPHTANPTMLYYPLQTHQLCVHHFSAFLDLFPFGSVMFPSFRRRWRRWCAMLVTWQRVR